MTTLLSDAMHTPHTSPRFTTNHFRCIRELVHSRAGILLESGKEKMVSGRLVKRLKALGMEDFDQYLRFIRDPGSGAEIAAMIDALTTNKTSFFRERHHFQYLRRHMLPVLFSAARPLRFWSAGCSSGEEPYSLAIELIDAVPDIMERDCLILATDISGAVLRKARSGIYPEEALNDISSEFRKRYFIRAGSGAEARYRVRRPLQQIVRFARLNLIESWPMKGMFDAIFCRNVMIYFDRATRDALVRRFWEKLPGDGYLFIGHSESLISSLSGFRYVQPGIYVK